MRRAVLPVAALVAAACVAAANFREAGTTPIDAPSPALPISRSGTSRTELARTVAGMTARIQARPDDTAAVLVLSEALLRVQRVNSDGRAVIVAEEHLRHLLQQRPAHYEARRMLGAVLLSQHRFGEAIAEAEHARAADPRDPWNYGVIGDGAIELGDYRRAFQAFDRMGQLAPGPAAYARTSYGLEVKGEPAAALDYMRMAADGTSPNDPESQAWHYTEIGDLLLQLGRVRDARVEYERAALTFAEHPLAIQGLARIRIIERDLRGARLMLQQQLAKAPTPDLAAAIGDLCVELGEPGAAEPYFRMVEQIERAAWANGPRQPQVLARFFIDHDRHLHEALELAEEAARERRDIFTMDVLASAYLKAGRLDDASKAAEAALRSGTRDARILWHAAEILAAQGDPAGALRLVQRIPSTDGIADLHVRAGVAALHARLSASKAFRAGTSLRSAPAVHPRARW